MGCAATSTLVSFARCNAGGVDEKALEFSLELAHETAKSVGANHVTIYQGGCPEKFVGRVPSHPQAVESAFSVINRYPNETPSNEIPEAHFLIDPSGFLRARYRHFSAEDRSAGLMRDQVSVLAKEPFVVINLHSH